MKRFIIIAATLFASVFCLRANGPTEVVAQYAEALKGFVNDGEAYNLETIDELLRGGKNKCYIDNQIARIIAREKGWEDGIRMHSDNYHNAINNWRIDGSLSGIDLNGLKWLSDWVEPRINIGKDQMPVYFVTAHTNLTGRRGDTYEDLFFVQGNNIVQISTFDGDDIGSAIAAYNVKDYEKAFKIFRRLAYSSRNARRAQYYYCVMLLKGQGCKHLPQKVRDMEAAWFCLSGYHAGDDDLLALGQKFNMELPFAIHTIWLYPPSCDGRRIIRKKNRYSIVTDSGENIVKDAEGYVGQFSKDGYAQISQDGKKLSLIDTDGKLLFPYMFDSILTSKVNGHFIGFKDGALMVLDDFGNVLKRVDGKYNSYMTMTFDNGHYPVVNGDKLEIFDGDGCIVYDSKDFASFSFNRTLSTFTLKSGSNGSGNTIYEYGVRW